MQVHSTRSIETTWPSLFYQSAWSEAFVKGVNGFVRACMRTFQAQLCGFGSWGSVIFLGYASSCGSGWDSEVNGRLVVMVSVR